MGEGVVCDDRPREVQRRKEAEREVDGRAECVRRWTGLLHYPLVQGCASGETSVWQLCPSEIHRKAAGACACASQSDEAGAQTAKSASSAVLRGMWHWQHLSCRRTSMLKQVSQRAVPLYASSGTSAAENEPRGRAPFRWTQRRAPQLVPHRRMGLRAAASSGWTEQT